MPNADTLGTRILQRNDKPTLVVRKARLTIEDGAGSGRTIELDGLSTVVGSDEDCDVVLDDKSVSGRHFEIVRTDEGCLLRDLGSTNGTFVGGVRALAIYLASNSQIVVGETRILFEVLSDDVEFALSRKTNFGGLLGHGAAMRATFAILEAAAKSEATVLILGESGTGKELAARAIHERSERRDGPYLVFDCGATSASLVESQLFGHKKGAFTGASDERRGLFEAANGGTLVIDEIGELPLELQPKLLRALESRTISPLGDTQARPIDVRFIASTHRNLREEVKAGRFREDLYFRLSVITTRMPPLRDRKDEIPRLCQHFLHAIAGDEAPTLPDATLELLLAHDWPGNCRELRNFVERFVVVPSLATTGLLKSSTGIDEASPAFELEVDIPFHRAKERFTDRFERAYLEHLLASHGDNLSEAARIAGLSRQTCYRLIRKHALRPDD